MAKKPLTYEQLKTVWYKKLKAKGFEDIEFNEDRLKKYSQSLFDRKKVMEEYGGWQAKATYYLMAEQFLWENEFKDNLEKTIWEYHTNGISARDIAVILQKAKIVAPGYRNISRRIKRLEDIMKSRYLTGTTPDDE